MAYLYRHCTYIAGHNVLNKTMSLKCSVNYRHYTASLFTSLTLRFPVSNAILLADIRVNFQLYFHNEDIEWMHLRRGKEMKWTIQAWKCKGSYQMTCTEYLLTEIEQSSWFSFGICLDYKQNVQFLSKEYLLNAFCASYFMHEGLQLHIRQVFK